MIKNMAALEEGYVPSRLLFREEQYGLIMKMLNFAKVGSIQMALVGTRGSGKTVTLKKALADSGTKHYYVYCKHTEYLTFLELYEAVTGKKKPGLGLSPWSDIAPRLKEGVVVLDEADKFMINGGDRLLYELTNASISTILVSNRLDLMSMIKDARVQSRLLPIKVFFKCYTVEELEGILWQRAREALERPEEVLDASMVKLMAAMAKKKTSDARYAINLLKLSVMICAGSGDRRVTEEHVREADRIISEMELEKDLANLSPQLKLMLFCTLNYDTPGNIYSAYNELAPKVGLEQVSGRRLQMLLSDLELLGFVRIVKDTHGYRKVRFNDNVDAERLKELLSGLLNV